MWADWRLRARRVSLAEVVEVIAGGGGRRMVREVEERGDWVREVEDRGD